MAIFRDATGWVRQVNPGRKRNDNAENEEEIKKNKKKNKAGSGNSVNED